MNALLFDLQRFGPYGTSWDDTLQASGSNSYIAAYSGNDSIYVGNYDSVTVDAGAGDDTVYNYWGWYASIDGGEGNDRIYLNSGQSQCDVTVKGGTGNDIIYGDTTEYTYYGVTYQFGAGDGYDWIYNYKSTDTISLGGSYSSNYYTRSTVGSSVVISLISGGAMTLSGASDKTVNVANGIQTVINNNYRNNSNSYSVISGTSYSDTIYNTGHHSTIYGGAGNDSITNTNRGGALSLAGAYSYIYAGDGSDYVVNYDYADYSYVDGGDGNDTIMSRAANSTIYGGYGSDSIRNVTGNVSINGGADNDIIVDVGFISSINNNNTISGGTGNDTISLSSSGYNNVIRYSSGDGNDYIYNYGSRDTISLGGSYSSNYYTKKTSGSNVIISLISGGSMTLYDASDKTINIANGIQTVTLTPTVTPTSNVMQNYNTYSLVSGTDSADTIKNYAGGVTIRGYGGNDYIYNSTESNYTINSGYGYVTIDGGAGDDTIYSNDLRVSINGGAGSDRISIQTCSYNTVKGGTGNDSVFFISTSSTRGGAIYQYTSGDGNDIIYDYASNDTISLGGDLYRRKTVGSDIVLGIGSGSITLSDAKGKTVNITGGTLASDNNISNSANYTVVNGTSSAETIYNNGEYVTINAGGGNDSIYNYQSNHAFISAGDGNDTIYDKSWYSTISAGTGNDVIIEHESGKNTSINGGAGNDKISLNSNSGDITVTGGTGNDTIYGDTSGRNYGVVYQYNSGDDNDLIYNFGSNSTLSIGGGSYSSKKSGDNLIVTVGEGKITLAGVTSANIKGTKKPSTVTNSWKLSGATATYGSSGKTLVTVKGVKSKSGLEIDTKNKIVTVAASALNKSNVTLTGDGYRLALADDVSATSSTSKKWSYGNSTATYKQTRSEKYSLAGNGKSITYSKATNRTLAKISGVNSRNGLSVNDDVITVPNSIIGSKKKVSVSGSGYEFEFAAQKTSIAGSAKADIITSTGSNSTINAGKGNDKINISGANNVVVYKSGDGKDTVTNYSADDTIKITSGTAKVTRSGSNVVFSVGSGSITLKDAASKTVTYYAGGKKKTYSATSSKPYTVSKSGKSVTLSSFYSKTEFSVEDDLPDGGAKIVTINASAVTHGLNIEGNANANYIIGTSGNDTIEGDAKNDTLRGGDGKDIFVYYDGYGNDTILDYTAEDKISIVSGAVKPKPSGKDVILNVGKGSIKIRNSYSVGITYIDSNDFEHDYIKGKQAVTVKDSKVTINKNYWKNSFDVEKFGEGLKMIDASSVSKNLKITGNDRANEILCGKSNCTVIGGKGDDTIYGGEGANLYVYKPNDGKDILYNYSSDDKISIDSGDVNISHKGDTVIFSVGSKGKISVDSAVGKTIKYFADGEQHTTIFGSNSNVVENWFVDDDDNFLEDNDLSSIVQSNSTDYSLAEVETSLKSANALDKLTYSDKK